MAAIVGSSVPDYQGLFLRGVGSNAAALGVQQGDAIRNIIGTTERILTSNPNLLISSSGAIKTSAQGLGNYFDAQVIKGFRNTWTIQGFDASRVVPTALENRPVNKSVRYLIRALE